VAKKPRLVSACLPASLLLFSLFPAPLRALDQVDASLAPIVMNIYPVDAFQGQSPLLGQHPATPAFLSSLWHAPHGTPHQQIWMPSGYRDNHAQGSHSLQSLPLVSPSGVASQRLLAAPGENILRGLEAGSEGLVDILTRPAVPPEGAYAAGGAMFSGQEDSMNLNMEEAQTGLGPGLQIVGGLDAMPDGPARSLLAAAREAGVAADKIWVYGREAIKVVHPEGAGSEANGDVDVMITLPSVMNPEEAAEHAQTVLNPLERHLNLPHGSILAGTARIGETRIDVPRYIVREADGIKTIPRTKNVPNPTSGPQISFNTFAINSAGEVVDPNGGLRDLGAGIIRIVGGWREATPVLVLRALTRWLGTPGMRFDQASAQLAAEFFKSPDRYARSQVLHSWREDALRYKRLGEAMKKEDAVEAYEIAKAWSLDLISQHPDDAEFTELARRVVNANNIKEAVQEFDDFMRSRNLYPPGTGVRVDVGLVEAQNDPFQLGEKAAAIIAEAAAPEAAAQAMRAIGLEPFLEASGLTLDDLLRQRKNVDKARAFAEGPALKHIPGVTDAEIGPAGSLNVRVREFTNHGANAAFAEELARVMGEAHGVTVNTTRELPIPAAVRSRIEDSPEKNGQVTKIVFARKYDRGRHTFLFKEPELKGAALSPLRKGDGPLRQLLAWLDESRAEHHVYLVGVATQETNGNIRPNRIHIYAVKALVNGQEWLCLFYEDTGEPISVLHLIPRP